MAMAVNARRRAFRIGGIDGTYAEQAFDAADNTANCATDNCADWPRRVHADRAAVDDAVWNALGVCRQRQSERYGNGGRK
jgi:hypothetical protein